MTEKEGMQLHSYKLTSLQGALIEWGLQNPYGTLHELTFQDGIPVMARVYKNDGTGTEKILFDKVARKAGLLK